MPTQDDVWKQVKALKHTYIFYTRKEINYLPKILSEGENVLAVTSGFMQNRTWLAACTDRRILFIDRGMFFGTRQVQINLDRLQTIESDVGLFFGSIRVVDAGSAMSIGMVLKQSIAPFVRTVQDAMDQYKRNMAYDMARATTNAMSGATHNVAPKPGITDELERLAKLKADGHLSEAEYASAKTKLLQH
jgi:Bacterial PH domain/Short C-terminal domain